MQGFQPQKAKKPSAAPSAAKPVGGFSPKSQPPANVQAMNQAPDTELGMMKPGEYVLPVDTVHAMGGADKLDELVQQTHTPAPEAAVVPEGAEPRLFFSNGGRVPGEEESRAAISQAGMSLPQDNAPQFHSYAAQGQYAARMPDAAPLSAPKQPTPSEMGVVAPTSPSNTFPGNRLHGASGFSGAPIRATDSMPQRLPGERSPEVTALAMQTPMDSGSLTFSTPQMRDGIGFPKPAPAAAAAPAAPDNMAGMAATGFHPGIAARAERAPAGVPTAGAPTTPTRTVGVPVGGGNSPTAMYFDDATTDIGQRWSQGDVAGATGAALRTAAGTVGMAGMEALDKTITPVVNAGGRFVDGLFGSTAEAQQLPPSAPASTAPPKPTTVAPVAAQQSVATAPQNAQSTPTQAAQAPATSNPAPQQSTVGTELPSGVYSHGRGQYSDSPQGMGFAQGFTGRPNAQNLAAASNLAASSMRDSLGRVLAAQQPQAGGFRAPAVTHSRNDATARENLRRAKMDATSIIHNSHWAPKESEKGAQERYNQLQQADSAAQAQESNLQTQAMGFNAQMMREQMNQTGALQRAVIGEMGASNREANRLGLEERRLAGEEVSRGFQVRQGQRLEKAQDDYAKAKTPAEREAALASIRALSGKADGQLKDNYMALGGGQEWDANAGVMRNVPQRLVDLRSGQEVGSQNALPPINQNPQALAIKNNTGLSADQKRQQLQALGYR